MGHRAEAALPRGRHARDAGPLGLVLERFRGQELAPRPRIAVCVDEKTGNFVVGTTMLRALREHYPDCTIDYFTNGERSREFEEASPLIDRRLRLEDAAGGAYELGVNVDFDRAFAAAMAQLAPRYAAGPTAGLPELDDRIGALWAERRWNRLDLLSDFADVLRSQYIGEIWCRLASLETDFATTEVPTADPGADVPDVLIATGGTRRTKHWPAEHWHALARFLGAEGLSVGLVGIARELQLRYYGAAELDDALVAESRTIDLRGRWTLPQVAGAAGAARAVVTLDNAIGHIAAGVGTLTLMIWGGSPWRLWAPRSANVRNVLPAEVCALCEAARFENADCLREARVCLESITPHRVFAELRQALYGRSATKPDQRRASGGGSPSARAS